MLTQAAADYKTTNVQMRRFAELVRRADCTYAHCWSAEHHPGGAGVHVHGFWHADLASTGDLVAALVDARDRAGFGLECGFEPVPDHAGVSYFAYGLKSLTDAKTVEGFLTLNGSSTSMKIIHASRRGPNALGFWRDGTNDRPLTQTQAENLASRRYWESRTGSLVPQSSPGPNHAAHGRHHAAQLKGNSMTAPTTSAPDTDTSWLETLPPEDEQSIQELFDNYGKNLVRAVLDGLDSGKWKSPAPTGGSTDV